MADHLDLLQRVIEHARRRGADAADALVLESTSLTVTQRLGALETLEREEGADLALRVLIGTRQALVSTADRSDDGVAELVDRALAMARVVPEDPFVGLATPDQLAMDLPELDLVDPVEPPQEVLVADAAAAEAAARAVPGITNSDGAEAAWNRMRVALAASNGFTQAYQTSFRSLSVAVLAGEGSGMERDYDYAVAVHGEDLERAELVGRRAGERTVRRLNASKPATCQLPVVFEPRTARSLVSHLASAINGEAIARGTSFLKDRLGEEVFAPGITIIDDPHRVRGLRSKPCDAEGLPGQRRALIANGVLTTWLLDLYTARKLGMTSTGHAARGTTTAPNPSSSNVHLEPGTLTPDQLIAETGTGIYVTELFGMGVNTITGDYSRGAAGFWIENGEITRPVSEVTIAGRLQDMFRAMTPANDLEFRYGMNAPTVRIDGMTIAGS